MERYLRGVIAANRVEDGMLPPETGFRASIGFSKEAYDLLGAEGNHVVGPAYLLTSISNNVAYAMYAASLAGLEGLGSIDEMLWWLDQMEVTESDDWLPVHHDTVMVVCMEGARVSKDVAQRSLLLDRVRRHRLQLVADVEDRWIPLVERESLLQHIEQTNAFLAEMGGVDAAGPS